MTLENRRSGKICLATLGIVGCIQRSRKQKLTKKFIKDEDGTDLLLPRMVVEKLPQVERGRFYVLFADIEAHGHTGSGPGCALLTSHGEEAKPRKDEFRERVGTIIESTLAEEARMETYEDRIAETARVRERRRARIEQGAVDVPEEPGDKDDEQVAVRLADASGGYIMKNQHEEKIMRDIQVSKRGSQAASEEQSDTWRKTERFEQEAPNASASSDPNVALENLASGETQSRLGSVLVQKSGHVDDDVQISAMDPFDGRRSRYIGGIEEKIGGDLKRSELVNRLRNGYVSTLSRGKFGKFIRRF